MLSIVNKVTIKNLTIIMLIDRLYETNENLNLDYIIGNLIGNEVIVKSMMLIRLLEI